MCAAPKMFVPAALLGLAAVSLPAHAAVTYSFAGGLATGSEMLRVAFIVSTPQFLTTSVQLSPAAASCEIFSPNFDSCGLAGSVFFSPRVGPAPPHIGFSALFKPVSSDFSISRTFGAEFGFPPGAAVFDTLGQYQATARLRLSIATLQVSGFADPVASPIPEPSAWLLLMGGLGLTSAVLRRRSLRAEPLLPSSPS